MTTQIQPHDPTLDVAGCDREPIHIPGAIQPHGLLLIAGATTLEVCAGAGAIEERLSPDWLGRPLRELIGGDPAALLADAPLNVPITAPPVDVLGEPHAVTLHRAGHLVLTELEPLGEEMSGASALAWLDQVGIAFERAATIEAACERAAVAVRMLSGFDRVMVYRFAENDAGCVLAEDRAPGLDSFLHHHFPASDIPRQARALYVRNRTRAIPSAQYDPAPIRPAGFAGTDLSDVATRSVSPIHLQYLRNMGVDASASISIVKDGVLWGLIACHHRTPRLMPPGVRAAAATLAAGLARQVRAREEAASYRERLRLHADEAALTPRLAADAPMREVIADNAAELRRLLGANGLALLCGSAVETEGTCPANLAEIARAVAERGEIFATRELGTLLPAGAVRTEKAAGVLAMVLPQDSGILLWFRPEQVEEIAWAGNPNKAAKPGSGGQLTPRASFESWRETVRGRSRAWSLEEIEAAHRLRRTIRDARQSQQLRALNAELQRALADRDALLAQKDVLMKEVNHRVQNSLQLVSAFLALQARASGGQPEVVATLTEAQARLSAVALVHRRLYRDDQVERVDLARYLEELAADVKTSIGPDWARQMQLDLSPMLVPTDRAVNIGLVLTELVINVTKYAYGGAAGPVTIALERYGDRLRLIVADEGRGKQTNGEGFGRRMMQAVVGRLSGELEFVDNRPGLRAILTAPVSDSA
jgi:light-regulated signal transduction histidine kinase (bacteriophytochrome)